MTYWEAGTVVVLSAKGKAYLEAVKCTYDFDHLLKPNYVVVNKYDHTKTCIWNSSATGFYWAALAHFDSICDFEIEYV